MELITWRAGQYSVLLIKDSEEDQTAFQLK